MRLLYTLLAAGTALTNSTTETVLGSYEIPANGLQAGKVYTLGAPSSRPPRTPPTPFGSASASVRPP